MTIEVKGGNLIFNGSPLIKYIGRSPYCFASLEICCDDGTKSSPCSCSEIEKFQSYVSKERKKEIALHKRILSFIEEVKNLPDGKKKNDIVSFLDMNPFQLNFDNSATPWKMLIRKIRDKTILFRDCGSVTYYAITVGRTNLMTERIIYRLPSILEYGEPMVGRDENFDITCYTNNKKCIRDLISHSGVVSETLNIGKEELIQKLNSQLKEVQK